MANRDSDKNNLSDITGKSASFADKLSGRINGGARFIAPSVRILIVDDIDTNLKLTEGLMLPYQMQIDLCKSGARAIEMVKDNRYDMIFMDYMMPEMDGIEATAKIRESEDRTGGSSGVPIIALTANAVSGVEKMFLQNGFNDFLEKPIKTQKLNALLEAWLPEEKRIRQTHKEPEAYVVPDFEIEGIDIKAGISKTRGSVENYLKMITIFRNDGIQKIGEIKSCMENNDIVRYTVYVHALKSACAGIGALELSELAKSLEAAGKNADLDFIKNNNPVFLRKLKNILINIENVIFNKKRTDDGINPPADKNKLKSEIIKLKEAFENMDIDAIDFILKSLRKMNLDNETMEKIDTIAQNALMCEYEEGSNQADEILHDRQYI